ncbi:MAG: hypothetical protein GF418_03195 [Chitinivibrionales bacterium]|nr:hypothetical protein [Chitinivibrionales bacterium]MBD3394608.1 hypothetical protein [Chitinivibrionales bacterium]
MRGLLPDYGIIHEPRHTAAVVKKRNRFAKTLSGVSLPQKHLDILTGILDAELGGRHARAYLFGSRARGDDRAASDIDLAIASDDDVSLELSTIRDLIEESAIPYETDVIDMRDADTALTRSIEQEGLLIWIN